MALPNEYAEIIQQIKNNIQLLIRDNNAKEIQPVHVREAFDRFIEGWTEIEDYLYRKFDELEDTDVIITSLYPEFNDPTTQKRLNLKFYEKMQTLEESVVTGIIGVAHPDDVVATTGFFRKLVHTAQVYTNYKDAYDVSIQVTSADLDVVNGVANNRVIIEVQDGVATKRVERVKGEQGPAADPAKLPLYSEIKSANIIAGTQFIDDENGNVQYRVLAGQTLLTTELPANVDGVKVEKIGIKNPAIMLSDIAKVKNITGSIVSGSYWNFTGVVTSYAGTKRTEKIPLNAYDEVWVKTNWTLVNLRIVFFNSSDAFISAQTHTGGVLTKITPPIGAVAIGVSADGANEIVVELRNNTNSVELLKTVSMLDDKLLTKDILPSINNFYYHKNTGVAGTITNFIASEKINVTPSNVKILLNGTLDVAVNGCCIGFWDASDVFIPYTEKATYSNEYIDLPANATKFAFSKRNTDTLTVKQVGKIIADSAKIYEGEAGLTTGKAANFYQLGEDYQSIKTRTAATNYGIIFAGQSNMVGQSAYADLATLGLPTSLDVNKWDGAVMTTPQTIASGALWGVWWSILKRLKDYKPSTPIYNFNISNGGSTLHTDWSAEKLGVWAKKFANEVFALKNYTPIVNIKCIVWIQGESDHLPPYDAEYYQRLKNFIAFTRGVIGSPIIPFIVVGHHVDNNRYNQKVRDAQIKVAAEGNNVIFINPDALPWTNIGDDLHYDGAYNEALAPLIFNVIKDL